ncbi:MAG TPA: ADOP family duplicated permease [Longimicrobiales bacterium]
MTAAKLYRALLGLLPRGVPPEERDEIAAAFAALYGAAGTAGRRLRVLLVSFGALPGVVVLEWTDHLSAGRGRARRKGDGMYGVWSAVRHGVRSLARRPAFTWSVVLLLGVGVGAVTAIFSVVDHVVLRPLPYPAAERLVKIEEGSHSGPTFERLAGMRAFESLAGIYTDDANLTGGTEPIRVREAQVTREFFPLFGARPAVGRLLVASDSETGGGVVLSHGAWVRLFGRDPGVVGRTVRIDGIPRVVVGVVDASFVPPEGIQGGADFWRAVDWDEEMFRSDAYSVLAVAARLAPGVTVAQAQAEADAVAARRAEEVPEQFRLDDGTPAPLPVTPLLDATVGGVRSGLGVVFGAVALLLLVACVNVAHLFLARGVERAREMSVRRALGAGAGVIARQIAIESLMVGLAGAVVGACLAAAGIGAFRAFGPRSLPRMEAISMDPRVLAFAVAVGLATSLLFGLLPALRLAVRGGENPLQPAARGSTPTRRAHALRHALVVAEVALSLVLAAHAGWLIRAFAELNAVDLGFRTENVWTLPLTLAEIETPDEWNRRIQGIRESLAAVPGVRAASFGLTMPLEFVGGNHCCWRTSPDFPGDEVERRVALHPVDADYFDLFQLLVVAGRTWTRAEVRAQAGSGTGSAAGVAAVVSEPLAVNVFGSSADALGQPMTIAGTSYTIVGVVADNRHYGPDQDHGPAAYIPASTIPYVPMRAHMAVLTDGPQAGLPRALAEAVWRVEPDLPVPVVQSMDAWATAATASARFISGLFGAFATIALLLVSGGLAGTLLYTVRVRRRELGIRLAVGATATRIERSVLSRGLGLALAGATLGSAGAWLSGRILDSFIADIDARDAGTFILSVLVLLFVALLSSWLPARSAARTDPMETLRVE